MNMRTLSGGSIKKKAVTIGTGSGTGANLAPGESPSTPTIQSTITLNADGTYSYLLNNKRRKAITVIANGVTIDCSAQFSFNRAANKKLAVGAVSTAIRTLHLRPLEARLRTCRMTPASCSVATTIRRTTKTAMETISR